MAASTKRRRLGTAATARVAVRSPDTPASTTTATRAPRRTQAQRTDASRRKLIAATIEVMRRRGYSGLTTLEVAEVAGLSRGALLHHFPSRHELVLATMRYMNDLVRAESQRRAAEAATGRVDPLEGIIRDAKDFFFSDFFFVSLAVAMSEVYGEDLRRQTRPLSRDSRLAVEAAWIDALVARGVDQHIASRVTTITLSIIRGFSIRVFIDDNRKHFDEVLETWKDMVRVYLGSAARDVVDPKSKKIEVAAQQNKGRSNGRKA